MCISTGNLMESDAIVLSEENRSFISILLFIFLSYFIRHKEHDDEERGNREQTFDGQKMLTTLARIEVYGERRASKKGRHLKSTEITFYGRLIGCKKSSFKHTFMCLHMCS